MHNMVSNKQTLIYQSIFFQSIGRRLMFWILLNFLLSFCNLYVWTHFLLGGFCSLNHINISISVFMLEVFAFGSFHTDLMYDSFFVVFLSRLISSAMLYSIYVIMGPINGSFGFQINLLISFMFIISLNLTWKAGFLQSNILLPNSPPDFVSLIKPLIMDSFTFGFKFSCRIIFMTTIAILSYSLINTIQSNNFLLDIKFDKKYFYGLIFLFVITFINSIVFNMMRSTLILLLSYPMDFAILQSQSILSSEIIQESSKSLDYNILLDIVGNIYQNIGLKRNDSNIITDDNDKYKNNDQHAWINISNNHKIIITKLFNNMYITPNAYGFPILPCLEYYITKPTDSMSVYINLFLRMITNNIENKIINNLSTTDVNSNNRSSWICKTLLQSLALQDFSRIAYNDPIRRIAMYKDKEGIYRAFDSLCLQLSVTTAQLYLCIAHAHVEVIDDLTLTTIQTINTTSNIGSKPLLVHSSMPLLLQKSMELAEKGKKLRQGSSIGQIINYFNNKTSTNMKGMIALWREITGENMVNDPFSKVYTQDIIHILDILTLFLIHALHEDRNSILFNYLFPVITIIFELKLAVKQYIDTYKYYRSITASRKGELLNLLKDSDTITPELSNVSKSIDKKLIQLCHAYSDILPTFSYPPLYSHELHTFINLHR